jgi:hypothetical protein
MTTEEILRSAVDSFRRNGHADPERMGVRLVRALENGRLRDHTYTPLIMSMLSEVFAASPAEPLPASRADLYRRFFQLRCRQLPKIATRVLPELAYDLRRGGEVLDQAERRVGSTDSPDLPGTAREILDQSGMFVEQATGYHFADPSFQHFLEAEYLRALRPVQITRWRYLSPRNTSSRRYPVAVFLAGLWLADGQNLNGWLRWLLGRRWHRTAALSFVATLVGDGAPIPETIVTRSFESLKQGVFRPHIELAERKRMAAALVNVHREKALTFFEAAIHRDDTCVDAAELLLLLDEARGDRVVVARLEDSPPARLGEPLWHLVKGHLAPERAAKLLATMLSGPVYAAATAEPLIAEMRAFDPDLARRVLEYRITPKAELSDDERRYNARELFHLDPQHSLPIMLKLGRPTASPQWRLHIGMLIIDMYADDGCDILTRLALDPDVRDVRIRIAAALGLTSEEARVACLATLASARGSLDLQGRLTVIKMLLDRAPKRGLVAIDELLEDHVPGEARVKAAEMAAAVDRGARLDRLAGSSGLTAEHRGQAALHLRSHDALKASGHLADLAMSATEKTDAWRLNTASYAAAADRKTGEKVLADLAGRLSDANMRVKAIEQLMPLNPRRAQDLAFELIKSRSFTGERGRRVALKLIRRELRTDALALLIERQKDLALRLRMITDVARISKPNATRLYRHMLDQGRLGHGERLKVTLALSNHEPKAAIPYLQDLESDHRVPKSIRKNAKSTLDRIDPQGNSGRRS